MSRTHDVVIFGATGFTGALVVEYFRDHAPAGLRWAVAGRTESKLKAVCAELKVTPTVLIADSSNEKSLEDLCRSTRVVLTTVGPYDKYGYPLAAACVKSGTHYCDITGEVCFIRRLIDNLHEDAIKNKALIVSSCGFDSVPGDLGNLMILEEAKRTHPNAKVVSVKSFYQMKGGISGGTIASGINAIENPEVVKAGKNPFLLTPSKESKLSQPKNVRWPVYDSVAGGWTAFFIMSDVNLRVVNRSNALRGVSATYTERSGPFGFVKCMMQTLITFCIGIIFIVPPLRNFAKKFLFPKPGEGPSRAVRESGFFKAHFAAELDNGVVLKGLVQSLKGDPGYKETSKMLSEAAITLALDYDQLPQSGGVLTPCVALGNSYKKRLINAGFDFYENKDLESKKGK